MTVQEEKASCDCDPKEMAQALNWIFGGMLPVIIASSSGV